MSSKSKIDRFREKFRADYGDGHYHFVCHAAFPVGFTVDLLYQLWANFKDLPQGSIDRLAVSDLLQSDLCRTTQRGIFEMELEVRNELLEELRRVFGTERELQLARFLYQYADAIQAEDIPVSFRDTQKMIALGTLAPNLAVERLAQEFNQQLDKGHRPEIYRMDSLIEALLKQNQAFANLRHFSKGIKGSMTGDILSDDQIQEAFGKVIKIDPSLSDKAEGVRITLPENLRNKLLSYRREITQEGEVEALKRIRTARESAAPTLNLSKLGLTYLPEELFALDQLEVLDLYDNALTEIPSAIAQLTNLEKLMASQNQLTTLPESLATLKNLKTVKFDSNQLGHIPEVIFSLENLEDLSLENNGIEFLSPDIQKLSELRLIDLRENPVWNIPQGRKKFTTSYLRKLWSQERGSSPKSAVVFLVQAGEAEAMLTPIRDAAKEGRIEAEVLTFSTLDELYIRCHKNAPHQVLIHLNFSNTNSGRLELHLGKSPVKIAQTVLHQLLSPLSNLHCLINTQAMSQEKAREMATGNIHALMCSLDFPRGADPNAFMRTFYERLAQGQTLASAVSSQPIDPNYEIFTNPDFSGVEAWSIPSTVIQQQQTATSNIGVDQFKDELLALIQQDELKELFLVAKQRLIREREIFDDFIILESRYQRLDHDRNVIAIITEDQYLSEYNQIRSGLLETIQEIDADDYASKPQKYPWDQPEQGKYGSLSALQAHLKDILIRDLDMTFSEMSRCLRPKSEVRDQLVLLQRRLSEFNRKNRGGTLNRSEQNVTKNQIIIATLQLINSLEEDNLNSGILIPRADDPLDILPSPMQIFLSYAEADQRMVNSLKAELEDLSLTGVEVYDPRESIAQESSLVDAEKSIEDLLHESEMVISIISPAYLKSEYCQQEMQVAARRADAEACIFLPVIYQNCDWRSVPALAKRQVLPTSGPAINMVKDIDGAIRGVANQIGEKAGQLMAKRNQPPRAEVMAMPDRPRMYLALQGTNARRITSQLSQVYLRHLSNRAIDWEVEQYVNEKDLLSKLVAYRDKLIWFHLLRDDIYRSNTRKGETGIDYVKVFEQVIKAPFLKLVILDQTANIVEVENLLGVGIPAVLVCPQEGNSDESSYLKDFYEKMAKGRSLVEAWNETVEQHLPSRVQELQGFQTLQVSQSQSTMSVPSLQEGLFVNNEKIGNWQMTAPAQQAEEFERKIQDALLQLNFVRQKTNYSEKQRQIQHPITIIQGREENAPGLLLKGLFQISELKPQTPTLYLDLGEINAENWDVGLSQQLAKALNLEGIQEITDIVEPINQRLEEGNLIIVGHNLQHFKSKDWVSVLDQLYELFFNDLRKTPNRLLIYFLSEETLPQLHKVENPNLVALSHLEPLEQQDIYFWLKEPAERLPHSLLDDIRKEVESHFRKEKAMPIRTFVKLVAKLASLPQLAESLLTL